jgi:hypothetical protein
VTKAPTSTTRAGEVEAALQKDLDAIAKTAPDLARSALAMTALALGRSIDAPGTSPTARSMCARALVEVVGKLNDQVPEAVREDDPVDQLAKARAKRTASP